jgi:hypothetical protein
VWPPKFKPGGYFKSLNRTITGSGIESEIKSPNKESPGIMASLLNLTKLSKN